jgi:cell division septal protein FtsQ
MATTLVVAFAAYRSPLATVRKVRLIMVGPLDPPEERLTRNRAEIGPGEPLLLFDAGRYAAGISGLPWVRKVDVGRTLLGTVHVRVEMRRPVARLACGGRRWELDEEGVVIRPARKNVPLPEITMCDARPVRRGQPIESEAVLGGLAAMFLGRDVPGLRPDRIAVDQSTGICFNNGDSVAIRLGRADDLPQKMALIARTYSKGRELSRTIEAMDVSCPQMPLGKPRASAPADPDSEGSAGGAG